MWRIILLLNFTIFSAALGTCQNINNKLYKVDIEGLIELGGAIQRRSVNNLRFDYYPSTMEQGESNVTGYVYQVEDDFFLKIFYSNMESEVMLTHNDIKISPTNEQCLREFLGKIVQYPQLPCYAGSRFFNHETDIYPETSETRFYFYKVRFSNYKGQAHNFWRNSLALEDKSKCSNRRRIKRERKDFNNFLALINIILLHGDLPEIPVQ